jgi:Ca2+-binding RTX toxin-like protein
LFGGLGKDDLYGDDFIGTDEESCPIVIVMGAIGNPEPCRDWLFGGFGDDQLYGGPGNDSIHGDILVLFEDLCPWCDQYYPDDWIELKNQGGPLPEFGSDTLHGNWGNDWMKDPGSTAGIQKNNFYGGEGDDVLIGGENRDLIWGGPGADEAWGNAGDDSLKGDDYGDPYKNYDKLYGGEGKDILSIADVMLGGPNPPGDPDTCKDNETTFKVPCDDGD